MSRKPKNKRPLFSAKDIAVLLDLIKPHKEILESNQTNPRATARRRNIWTNIETQYNTVSDQPKTVRQLQKKYKSLKYPRKSTKLVPTYLFIRLAPRPILPKPNSDNPDTSSNNSPTSDDEDIEEEIVGNNTESEIVEKDVEIVSETVESYDGLTDIVLDNFELADIEADILSNSLDSIDFSSLIDLDDASNLEESLSTWLVIGKKGDDPKKETAMPIIDLETLDQILN